MSRIYNFSAGPAMLPEEVLQQAREDMLDWKGYRNFCKYIDNN